MRRLALTALLLAPSVASAQSILSDQIGAVDAAQQRHDYVARQAWDEQQRQQRAASAAAQARQDRIAAAARAAAAEREKKLDARQARDDAYEDRLRELELQDRALSIQAKKTDVSRENDIIDSELSQKGAVTDLIKSHADSNRNLSEGEKTLLEKKGSQAELEGQAAVKKESGLFH